jgi:hypothetical protein
VKTNQGRVIEFQHSYLKPEERQSRESFYGSMIWIVDGLRRKRDKPSFYEALCGERPIGLRPLTFLIPSHRCALLRDWADSRVSVFFDFGIAQEDISRFGMPVLWHLSPKSQNGWGLLTPVSVFKFVEAHLRSMPLKGICIQVVERRIRLPFGVHYGRPIRRPQRPISFEQYMARKRRARSQWRM